MRPLFKVGMSVSELIHSSQELTLAKSGLNRLNLHKILCKKDMQDKSLSLFLNLTKVEQSRKIPKHFLQKREAVSAQFGIVG